MALGGARPGAGRKPGVSSKPKIADYYTPEEIKKFVADLKVRAKKDNKLAIFIAEQIFGKAPNPVQLSNPDGSPILIKNGS